MIMIKDGDVFRGENSTITIDDVIKLEVYHNEGCEYPTGMYVRCEDCLIRMEFQWLEKEKTE